MNRTAFTSMVFALLVAGGPVFSQEAPPSEGALQMPASAMPAQPEPQMNASGGGSSSSADPCPQPKGALAETPDDLAKVQEEIDRFTLCVQRAQLLERLNESAMKNENINDAALGYIPAPTGMAPGLAGPQGPAGLAPLPAAALAGMDVSPSTSAPAVSGKQTEEASAQAEVAEAVAKEEEEQKRVWTIREIFGNGAEVQARLVSPEGDEVKAKNGMKLPDGKTTVVRITPAGVTVRDSSGAKSLEWAKS